MTREEKIIETMNDEVFAEDRKEAIESAMNCDHQCSGNCRIIGCNCACGEWHIVGD